MECERCKEIQDMTLIDTISVKCDKCWKDIKKELITIEQLKDNLGIN